MHIALLDRKRLQQIEALTLGNPLHHVDQHDISQFLGCNPVRRGGPYVPCSYDGYFLPHISPKPCSRSFGWRTRWSSPWSIPASAARNRRLHISVEWFSQAMIRSAWPLLSSPKSRTS